MAGVGGGKRNFSTEITRAALSALVGHLTVPPNHIFRLGDKLDVDRFDKFARVFRAGEPSRRPARRYRLREARQGLANARNRRRKKD
jgi:hypothetical protein